MALGAAPLNPYGPRQQNLIGVGAPPVNPYSYGPRQIPLVGVRGGAPPKNPLNPYSKPPYTRKIAPVVARTPQAPKDPWTDLLTKLMGSYETPAEQEARVNREIGTQIAAQQKLIEDDYARQRADAMAQMQASAAAGQAAAAMNRDLFSQVGGEYNAAASEISGLAHGLSGAAAGATSADIASQNAGLANVGMPGITVGGQFGTAGPGQAGVEEFRGGTLPAQNLTTTGEAANFGLAGMIGAQNLRATQEAQAALSTSMHEIRDNQSKAISALAAGRADLYHTYMADARDAQVKTISLAQGIQAAQSATGTAAKPITKLVGGNLMQWDPVNGRWIRAVKGDAAAKAAAKVKADAAKAAAKAKAETTKTARPNPALSKIYEHVVDSDGNAILGPDGKLQPVASGRAAGATKVSVPLSRATGVWRDTGGKAIPALNKPGSPKPPPFFKPGAGKKNGADKPTREDLQQAGEEVRGYGLYQRALAKVKTYNQKQIAAGATRAGQDWTDNPITADQISGMNEKQRAALGLTAAELSVIEDPRTLQEVYISLAHALGGRRAWKFIRKTYPKFGAGYYR